MKLFSEEKAVALESTEKFISNKEEGISSLESDLVSLEKHVDAYVSLGVVHEAVANESFNLVD